jgi:hypothetical protein
MLRLLLFAAAIAATASVSGGTADALQARSFCGAYRWAVKTLQDRPTLLPTRTTTIRFLVTRRAPESLPSTRLPFERHVYRVTARVGLFRPEDDGDIHVVLRDTHGNHMITETPSPGCTAGATLPHHIRMVKARRAVERCVRPEGAPQPLATVTGVAFFDIKHGQTGVAPNGIELHPILSFRCLG